MEEQLGIIRKTVEIRAEKIIKLLYDSMFFSKECVKFSSVRKKKRAIHVQSWNMGKHSNGDQR